MTPERYKRMREIFNAAVERPDAEEFARAECGDDDEMCSRVLAMLRANAHTAWVDQPPAMAGAAPARAAPGPVFREGQIVGGRYRIVRYLSRGGMGEVYEAEDLDLPEMKEHVALKTLLPEIAEDQSMVARFRQEIALSRKVQHPNVCAAFDLARHETEGSNPILFLTMPFLPGENLASRLHDGGRMQPSEALPLLEQMADGLDAAHRAGVIHRDFKPSNVMLVPSAEGLRAVVTDFGLARRLATGTDTTLTLTAQVAGTLEYMAPELLTGSLASVSSDVYALGMTAYRMTTGALPFASETPLAGAIRRAKEPVPPPRASVADLEPKWDVSITRALEAKAGHRFTSAGEFVRALRGEIAPSPIITWRRMVTAGLAAALAMGGLVGWRYWRNVRNRPPAAAEALYLTGVEDIHAGAYFAATKALGKAVEIAPRYAMAHARLADAWLELDTPDKAKDEMLVTTREDLSGLPEMDRLQIEAIDLETTREYAAAVAKYEQIERRASRNSENVSIDLAREYEKAGDPKKAVAIYLRLTQGPGSNPAAWLRLAVLYARQANAGKADEAFAQAEQLYQMTSNLEGLAETALQQGIAANARGHLDAGAAYLKKSLDTARFAGNLQQEITATVRLSNNAYMAGDAAAAERYARTALETAQHFRLADMTTRALVNLGNVSFRTRDFAGAEKYYNDALSTARQDHSSHLTALCQASLASLHAQLQRSQEAVREAQQALAYYQPNGYLKESLQCLTIVARAKRDGGDYQGALDSFRGLLQAAERVQDHSLMALAHENIGTLLFGRDHLPEALEEYKKNLELSADAEHIGYAALQCANTLWRTGRYGDAEAMFKKADAIAGKFPSLRLLLMYGRANMLLSQNRQADAADAARRAMEADPARNPEMQASLKQLVGLALLREGRKNEGLKDCEESLAVIEGFPDADDTLRARVAVLEARVENRDKQGALQAFHGTEADLAGHAELLWRARAFASRADPQYFGPTQVALQQLSREWGQATFNAYLARPDIRALSRPFFPLISAK